MVSRHNSPRIILDAPAKIALVVIAGAWVVTCLGGGSARADVWSLVPVRLAAVAGLALLLLVVPGERLRVQRPLLLFTLAAAVALAIQLIPLPPSLWASLPGRDFYRTLAETDSVGPVWRPISFSPDLTWNSLLSLVPPLLFLLAVPVLGTRVSRRLLIGLWITIMISGLIGLVQMAGGPDSPLRLYPINNQDSAIGLFANRNHQAAFLAMGIPLAAWWAGQSNVSPRLRPARWWIAASSVLFLLMASVMTQSRMGAIVVGLSLLLTAAQILRTAGLRRKTLLALGGAGLVVAALAGIGLSTWWQARFGMDHVEQDVRARVLPETVLAAKTFFPVGAGWGSFAQVYPRFESNDDLSPEYLNHTHSELTQIVIEGGVVAIALLLVFLFWYVRASWRAWRKPNGPGAAESRLCTSLLVLPLVASITDYPLRTPLMACAFAAAAAVLASALREGVAKG